MFQSNLLSQVLYTLKVVHECCTLHSAPRGGRSDGPYTDSLPLSDHFQGGGGGAQNGQVAVSAFGSGCACPTAVIAICPICQCSAEPQLEVCSAVHPSSLCPLAAFASWALQGYACIQVKGHSLPVVLL